MSRKVAAASAAGQDEVAEPDARQRELVEFLRDYENVFRATARRCSLSEADAEDALQRATEILLSRAPATSRRVRASWMHVVVRHEALRIRRLRRRAMPGGDSAELTEGDGVQPLEGQRPDSLDPAEMYERQDQFARFRQSFRRLKRDERRALTMIGEGYSYAEIGELTGWSHTKINRLLSEGRTKMREMLGHLESGRRCAELVGPLSRFCDGEASEREERELRDHLASCMACRARLRSYRLTSGTAALVFPLSPGRIERYLQEAAAWFQSRLPGRGQLTEAALALPSPGGGSGAGVATLAKLAVVCVGVGGSTGACLATGLLPMPDLPGRGESGQNVRQVEEPTAAQPTVSTAEAIASPGTTTESDAETGSDLEPNEGEKDQADPGPPIPTPTPEQAEFGPEVAGSSITLPRRSPAARASGSGSDAGPPPDAMTAAPVAEGPRSPQSPESTGSNPAGAVPPVRPPLAGAREFGP